MPGDLPPTMAIPASLRKRHGWHSVACAVSLFVLIATPVRADELTPEQSTSAEELKTQARADFARGNDAFMAGDYETAARAFEDAHEKAPHAAPLYNAARAWEKALHRERAADRYAEALARDELSKTQTQKSQEALSRLRASLGWVEVSGDDAITVSIGTLEHARLPFETHLAPGEHVLRAQFEPDEEWTQVVLIVAGSAATVVVRPPEPEPEPEPEPAVVSAPEPIDTSKRDTQRTWGFVALGSGAALGITSIFLGMATVNANDEFEQSDRTDQEAHDRAVSLQAWTNVMAFSGLAIGGTGAVLLLTLPKQPKGPETTLGLGPTSVSLCGRF